MTRSVDAEDVAGKCEEVQTREAAAGGMRRSEDAEDAGGRSGYGGTGLYRGQG